MIFRESERFLLGGVQKGSNFKIHYEYKYQDQNQNNPSFKVIWNLFPILQTIFLNML